MIHFILISLMSFSSLLAFEITERSILELKNIPAPTKESIYWQTAYNSIPGFKSYIFKGKVLRLAGEVFDKSKGDYVDVVPSLLSFYDNPKLEGAPSFKMSAGNVLVKDKEVCRLHFSGELKKTNRYSLCKRNSCKDIIQKDKEFIEVREDLNTSMLESVDYKSTGSPCRYKVEILYGRHYDKKEHAGWSYDFQNATFATDKSYFSIKVNGKQMYVDTKFCKQYPDNCLYKDVKYSQYEEDWAYFWHFQKQRPYPPVVELIKDVKSCLDKSDTKCMQDLFFTPKDSIDLESYDLYSYVTKIDDEILRELKACFKDYSRLMIHGKGMRGINKICVFGTILRNEETKTGIVSLVYPEAIRNDTSDFKVKVYTGK